MYAGAFFQFTTGLIKVHKEGAPIRPVINWRNAPGYKLAQMLVKVLSSHTPFPFTYNVRNTVQLMDDLLGIPQGHRLKFASFDISNMYSNIPTRELTAILKDLCIRNNVDNTNKKEILKSTQTRINQNYFQFQVYVCACAHPHTQACMHAHICTQCNTHTIFFSLRILPHFTLTFTDPKISSIEDFPWFGVHFCYIPKRP